MIVLPEANIFNYVTLLIFCAQKSAQELVGFLAPNKFIISSFTENASHGTGPCVGYSILHTDQYHAEKASWSRIMFLPWHYFFLPSHESAAIVAAMVMAPCLCSLHDIITFVAALG